MEEPFAPRPTGKPEENIILTGKLMPWGSNEQPVLLQMPACDDFFLPLFSTEENLRALLEKVGISFSGIKHIDDGLEFLDGLPWFYVDKARLRIIVDPRFTEEGRVRFIEVQREVSADT